MTGKAKLSSEYEDLCPLCGRELEASSFSGTSWLCRCGEIIPEGLEVRPRLHPPASNARSFSAELESAIRQGLPGRKRA